MLLGGAVTTAVGRHKCDRGEEVGVLHAPAGDDLGYDAVVEGQQGFPEARVLVAERGVHVNVEAVVYEHQLGFPRGGASYEDVPWVWIAVYPAPEEHLCGEEVDHGGHHLFQGNAQAAFIVESAPVVPVWLDAGVRDIGISKCCSIVVGCSWSIIQRRALATRRALPPASTPGSRDSVLVPETHAFYPFRRHDTLGAEIAIDFRDVYPAPKPLLAGNQF